MIPPEQIPCRTLMANSKNALGAKASEKKQIAHSSLTEDVRPHPVLVERVLIDPVLLQIHRLRFSAPPAGHTLARRYRNGTARLITPANTTRSNQG
jgi:hypothetical protein